MNIEKTDLLVYSIEDQLLIHINAYTTYMILERQESDKWVRHFDSYKDFEESKDDDLIGKAFYFINSCHPFFFQLL